MPLPPALASTSLVSLTKAAAERLVVRAFTRLDETPLRRWRLMLNRTVGCDIPPALPLPSHWAYFQGFDGGEFPIGDASLDGLLPVLDARRRWAGGSFSLSKGDGGGGGADQNAMRLGDLVERSTRIASVQVKRGRSGQFAVLRLEDEFRIVARRSAVAEAAAITATTDNVLSTNASAVVDASNACLPFELQQPVLVETRDIVYPLSAPFVVNADSTGSGSAAALALNVGAESGVGGVFHTCLAVHEWCPSADLLFRFSTLTGNNHRIHYDLEYARRVEGLPGLLVHGPLAVALACDALHACLGSRRRLKRIEYRNLTPLVCGERLYVGVHSPVVTDTNVAADLKSLPSLHLISSSASETGFICNVWTADDNASDKATELWCVASTMSVSIWNARRQLAVTMRAEFCENGAGPLSTLH